jgi:hypothetical protein
MAKKEEQELPNGFDAKAMIAENGAKRTVIRYADRVKLEIVQDTRHYKAGQIITPHKVMGEALIKQGIAKEYKEAKS